MYAATRLANVLPSASAGVSQTAKKLKAEGHDVIDLGLGEPDFATPAHIIEAAHQAALAGQTKYPPTDGTAELKSAIVAKLQLDNQLSYNSNEVIVSNGAKQVIFNALMASTEASQQVLLCAPFFDSYQNIALVQGLRPVVIPCSAERGFRLTAELLESHINKNTRWLFLNSPSNPAGVVYTRDELKSFAEVLLRHPQVLVLSDEIYEKIIFDDHEALSIAAVCPQLKDRTLTVNGVSKAYAMTGWRVGYGAGPATLIDAMTKVQSQISSGVCSMAQAAATTALNGPQDDVALFREVFNRRRNLVVERIASIDELSLAAPAGAFYALISCGRLIGRSGKHGSIKTDVDFVNYLLDQYKVAAVPGSTYAANGFFRISTANSDENLSRAMDRMAECALNLSTNR